MCYQILRLCKKCITYLNLSARHVSTSGILWHHKYGGQSWFSMQLSLMWKHEPCSARTVRGGDISYLINFWNEQHCIWVFFIILNKVVKHLFGKTISDTHYYSGGDTVTPECVSPVNKHDWMKLRQKLTRSMRSLRFFSICWGGRRLIRSRAQSSCWSFWNTHTTSREKT